MHIYLCAHSQEDDFDVCVTPPMNNLELLHSLVEEILVVSLTSLVRQILHTRTRLGRAQGVISEGKMTLP